MMSENYYAVVDVHPADLSDEPSRQRSYCDFFFDSINGWFLSFIILGLAGISEGALFYSFYWAGQSCFDTHAVIFDYLTWLKVFGMTNLLWCFYLVYSLCYRYSRRQVNYWVDIIYYLFQVCWFVVGVVLYIWDIQPHCSAPIRMLILGFCLGELIIILVIPCLIQYYRKKFESVR